MPKSTSDNNKYIKTILPHICLMAAGPIIGLILLLIAVALPTDAAKSHVYDSLSTLQTEAVDEELIDGFNATLTGNFTDCLMLQNAIYSSSDTGVLSQAMHMYRLEAGSDDYWLPLDSLTAYLGGENIGRSDYPRYWHGYIVILKPLLMLTSVNSIRLLNSALLLYLLAACLILLAVKKSPYLAGAFGLSMPFMFFFSTYASLSQSVCMYIMLIGVILLTVCEKKFEHLGAAGLFFMAMGMVTSYFDFLTYPLVTLGFPLCIYLFGLKGQIKNKLIKLIILSGEWSAGYVWMWASKWVLSDLLTDTNTIKDALRTILVRTGSGDDYNKITGFVNVLKCNLGAFTNWGFLLVIAGIVAVVIICLLAQKNKQIKIAQSIPFICLSLFPFIWFFLTTNHSMEHWMFTCRILSVTVFALVTAILSIRQNQ